MSSTNRNEGIDLAMESGPSTFIRQAFYTEIYKSFKNKPRTAQPLSKHVENKLDAAIAKLTAEQNKKSSTSNA
jgi:adenine C2-methylase RlmN of 23S rRNA A2503 and tRNA A37